MGHCMRAVQVLLSGTAVVHLVQAAHAEPTFNEIAPLPGFEECEVSSLSANGRAVVGLSSLGSTAHAFLWTAGSGSIDLGTLPGGLRAYARGVNRDGSVVVGQSTTMEFSAIRAFRWTQASGMVDLGLIPGGASSSCAVATSADGRIVVGTDEFHSPSVAFRWTETDGMVRLDPPAGTTGCGAFDTTPDGEITIGWCQNTVAGSIARWTQGAPPADLGGMPRGGLIIGNSISFDGSTIVGFGSVAPSYRFITYSTPEGLRIIETPPDWGDGRTLGYSTTTGGDLIVGEGATDGEDRVAVVWSEALGLVRLDELLTTLGLDVAGWKLTYASDISSDGSAITGSGQAPGSTLTTGWIVTGLPVLGRCTPDLTGSADPLSPFYGIPDGIVDAADFFYFLDQFALGSETDADLSGSADPNADSYGVPDGFIDASDFFFFLDAFSRGCV
ncbi:MAG: hypothetical protein IT439_04955 [Phycisphaerales bacterium]|nr:hypothetical protein [Phycisphaerales bacterium]